MDKKPRKLMTTHKALYSTDDRNRLYVSKKEGRRLVSIEDCVEASRQGLKDYIKKTKKD